MYFQQKAGTTFIRLGFGAKGPGWGVGFIQGFVLWGICTGTGSLHVDPQRGSGTVRLIPPDHFPGLFGLLVVQATHWRTWSRFRSTKHREISWLYKSFSNIVQNLLMSFIRYTHDCTSMCACVVILGYHTDILHVYFKQNY